MDRLRLEQSSDEAELKRQKSERDDLEALLRGVKERISTLVCDETTATHMECVKKLDSAIRLLQAMQALTSRVKVENARFLSEDLVRQLDALSEPLRSLSDEVAMARLLLDSHLSKDAQQADDEYNVLAEEVKTASASKNKLEGSLKEYSSNHGQKLGEKGELNKAEVSVMLSLERLVASKLLPDTDACPRSALSVLATEVEEAEARKVALENGKANLGAERAGIQGQIKSTAAELDRHQSDFSIAEKSLRTFSDEDVRHGLAAGHTSAVRTVRAGPVFSGACREVADSL